MEMVLNNGFCELSMDEMCEIDGGGGKLLKLLQESYWLALARLLVLVLVF